MSLQLKLEDAKAQIKAIEAKHLAEIAEIKEAAE